MNFVILVDTQGNVKTFRSVGANDALQVFNTWRHSELWVYIAHGNDFLGIIYSERRAAQGEPK